MTEAKVTNGRSRPSIGQAGSVASHVSMFLVMLVGIGLAGANMAQAEPLGGFVVPGSRAAAMDSCVEPTRAMRRYHMEYIRHQRDTTVYDGIRHTKYSLSGCVDCHAAHDANGVPVPVSDKGQFCNACHETAAVTLNCFDCHATVPDGESWNQVTEEGAPGQSQAMHAAPRATPVGAGALGSAGQGRLTGAALAQLPRTDDRQRPGLDPQQESQER